MAGSTPSSQPNQLQFQSEDVNFLRLHVAINKVGQSILHVLFNWTYSGGSQPLYDYFISEYPNAKKTGLSKEQVDKLHNYVSPAEYDITLLCSLLRMVCSLDRSDSSWLDSINRPLEYLINCLKKERNGLMHNTFGISVSGAKTRMRDLRNLYTELLQEAGRKFSKVSDSDAVLKKVTTELDDVEVRDMSDYKEQIKELRQHCKDLLVHEGCDELRACYKDTILVDLSPDLSGSERWEVQQLYIPMPLEIDGEVPETTINLESLFSFKNKKHQLPAVITLVASAGMGKTTTLKQLLSNWCDGTGLQEFDVVFHLECRSCSCRSLDDVVRNLLHDTVNLIKQEDFELFKESVLSLDILFLIDGFDEADSSVRVMLKELLSVKNLKARFVCTTRPSGKLELLNVIKNCGKTSQVMNIKNIVISQWRDFVDNVFKVYLNCPDGQKDGRDRIYLFLQHQGKHIWPILTPHTLTWLGIVYVFEPSMLDELASVSSVYEYMDQVMINKLSQRLATCYNNADEFEEQCHKFLCLLDKMAYKCLIKNELVLSQQTVSFLRSECTGLNLPEKDMLSLFLNCRVSLHRMLPRKSYCFLHKSNQEYRSAKYICNLITEDDTWTLKELFTHTVTDSKLLVDVLLYVSEILGDKDQLESFADTVVNIGIQAGLTTEEEWFMFLKTPNAGGILAPRVGRILREHGLLNWVINDALLPHAEVLLNAADPVSLKFAVATIYTPPADLPNFRELLQKVYTKPIKLHLSFVYYYVKYDGTSADELLRPLLENPSLPCTLEALLGSLSEEMIALLPSTLMALVLKVNEKQLCGLANVMQRFSSLEVFEIHVDMKPTDQAVQLCEVDSPVPIIIAIPWVGDDNIAWACDILESISKRPYKKIKLFDSTLTAEGGRNMINALHARGIGIIPEPGNFFEVRTTYGLSEDEKTSLNELASSCGYQLFWRMQ